MSNILFISDTHFSHARILEFENPEGGKIRPGFSCVEEMDEHIVDRWNATVRPYDKVYHLGDVTMSRKDVSIVGRLNGHKRLIRGNHDLAPIEEYLKHFDDVYASRVLDNMIFTHIPIHPESLGRFRANVHGHIHASPGYGAGYLNVSVEAINYTPVSLEEIKRMV